MNTLESLTKAIQLKKPISFEYNKEGKVSGKRIGNPHAVFIFTAKNTRIQSTKVHIVQTGGVTDTELSDFPDWRMFNIAELSNVEVLEGENQFAVDEKYNPEWEGYKDVIAKI